MNSPLCELSLAVPQDQVEPASDQLMELGALSVTVKDADADSELEQPLFGEPGVPISVSAWNTSVVKALFSAEPDAVAAATFILSQEWEHPIELLEIQEVKDQDWVSLTQSQFSPVQITPEFWIVPSWHQAPKEAKQIIQLDPGMAFGTGTHATTHMCLKWLAQQPALLKSNPRVLDYGCGSGILAIAASLFGAQQVDAVDIDEAAVKTAAYNAEHNRANIQTGSPDLATGVYDIVLANILASPLKLLASLLCSHVAPKGHLVLAGILERQADELKAAYSPWVKLEVADLLDGWILMTATKTDD